MTTRSYRFWRAGLGRVLVTAATASVALIASVATTVAPAHAMAGQITVGGGLSTLPAVPQAWVSGGGDVRWAYFGQDRAIGVAAVLQAANGATDAELLADCVEATNTPGATHALESSASDETAWCATPPAVNVLPPFAKTIDILPRVYQTALAVTTEVAKHMAIHQAEEWLARWVDRILPHSGRFVHALSHYEAWTPPPAPVDPGGGAGGGVDTPPTPVPTPLAERDIVINRILDAQPAVDPAVAGKAADKCIASAKAAAMTSQPCTTMPILFPGVETGAAGIHDRDAILRTPSWFQLTYEDGASKETSVPRGWYNRADYRDKCKPEPRKPRGVECDEYPWYTTVEGGPGASLEEVPLADNRADGNALQAMQDDFQCQMAFSAPLVRDNVGSGTQRFLVVPLVVELPDDHGKRSTDKDDDRDRGKALIDKHTTYAGPPSFHICRPANTLPPGGGNAS